MRAAQNWLSRGRLRPRPSRASVAFFGLMAVSCSRPPEHLVATGDADPLIFAMVEPSAGGTTRPGTVRSCETQAARRTRQARRAIASDDWKSALGHLKDARAACRAYDTSANLGAAFLVLERYADACTYLDEAARDIEDDGSPEEREKLARYLSYARERAAAVQIQSSDGAIGAALVVDGRVRSSLPVRHAIFVSAGEHRFEAALNGRRSLAVVRDLREGEQISVELPPLEPLRIPAPSDGAGALPIAFGAAIAGGVAATIVGGILLGLSVKLGHDADAMQGIGAPPVTPACAGDPGCDDVRQMRDKRGTYMAAGLPLVLGGGALALGGGLGLIVTWAESGPSRTSEGSVEPSPGRDGAFQIHPIVTSDTAGLGVGGRF